MKFWQAFLKLDRRIIYIVIALAVAIPLIKPMGLPIVPTSEVISVFDDLEELEPGSRVWIAMDYDPASQPELQPMTLAILRHAFDKKLRVIVMTLWPAGPNLIVEALDEMEKEYSLEAGTDYVNLGYKPGGVAVILAVGQNMKDTFPVDMFGSPTANMPILSDINSIREIDYVIDIAAGSTVDWWIIYGQSSYGFPLAAGCTAVSASQYYPYLDSGQLTGLIGGLKGAAEYEKLQGTPKMATSGMDAQSVAHLVLVIAIILANIGYIVTLRKKGAA